MTWGEYIDKNPTTKNYGVYITGKDKPSKVTIIEIENKQKAFLIHCGFYDGFTNQKVVQYTPASKLKEDSMYRGVNLWELNCIVEKQREPRVKKERVCGKRDGK